MTSTVRRTLKTLSFLALHPTRRSRKRGRYVLGRVERKRSCSQIRSSMSRYVRFIVLPLHLLKGQSEKLQEPRPFFRRPCWTIAGSVLEGGVVDTEELNSILISISSYISSYPSCAISSTDVGDEDISSLFVRYYPCNDFHPRLPRRLDGGGSGARETRTESEVSSATLLPQYHLSRWNREEMGEANSPLSTTLFLHNPPLLPESTPSRKNSSPSFLPPSTRYSFSSPWQVEKGDGGGRGGEEKEKDEEGVKQPSPRHSKGRGPREGVGRKPRPEGSKLPGIARMFWRGGEGGIEARPFGSKGGSRLGWLEGV